MGRLLLASTLRRSIHQTFDRRDGGARSLSMVDESNYMQGLGPRILADQSLDLPEGNIDISMANVLIPTTMLDGIRVFKAMTGPGEWRI